MHIAVVGSGHVGLVAGACFAELGHQVVVVDNDPGKLAALQAGEALIHERHLPVLLERHRGRRLCFSGDLDGAVRASAVIFIAVGTPPTTHGEADMSYVEAVAEAIAGALTEHKIVVSKSTVPVYTCDWIRKVMARNGAAYEAFDVAVNPEFLREGTAVCDFLYPDRIVIGCDSPRCAASLKEIYEPLTDGSYARRQDAIPAPDGARIPPLIIVTTPKTAELVKHASNAFLAMKVSFINAVSTICESVGANLGDLCQGIGSDPRIGQGFLRPGIGYGGSCFPKDLMAFRAVARECGYDFRLLGEVARINEEQCQRFLRKARNALWTLKGKRLAALGLAFKGGTDDVRESPALAVIGTLLEEGCEIVAYDPAAMEAARATLPPDKVRFASDAYQAAAGADALLILTDWEEFSALDLDRMHAALKYPIVIDGRNLFDPDTMRDHGFQYFSVGRPAVNPKERVAAQGKNA